MTDDFILEAIDILTDVLKKHSFEDVRRVNFLVNIARKDELKEMIGKLKSSSMIVLSEYADMITRVFKDDEEYLSSEPNQLDKIFITKRHGKMERFIAICNCAYLALKAPKKYRKTYQDLYNNTKDRF